jgi:hypothetical protein
MEKKSETGPHGKARSVEKVLLRFFRREARRKAENRFSRGEQKRKAVASHESLSNQKKQKQLSESQKGKEPRKNRDPLFCI